MTSRNPCLGFAEGHSKPEAIRNLKRYIAREVYGVIMQRQKQINPPGIAA